MSRPHDGNRSTDFVVYNPFQRIPIYIVRIERNEEVANAIAERVALANEFIEEKIEKQEHLKVA